MVKSLLNKIFKRVRGGVLKGIAFATISLFGCTTFGPWEAYTNSSTNYSSSSSSSDPSSETNSSSSAPSEVIRDISGSLQDNESDSGKPGIIKVYDGSSNLIRNIPTEVNGYFNMQLTNAPIDLILQGKITNDLDSYVRTIRGINGQIGTNLGPVRAVPKPDFGGVTKEGFRQHMKDINFDIYSLDNDGLRKWDLNNLMGMEILLTNPNPAKGYFTATQQDFIANKIKASDDIEKFVDGKELDGYIQKDTASSIKHYTTDISGKIIDVEPGWIVVAPDVNVDGGLTGIGYLSNTTITGTINRAIIKLGDVINNAGVSHEFGHAFIAPNGEAQTISPDYTIMWSTDGDLIKPGIADEKAGKLVYESTYAPREKLDDILGTNWAK